MSGDFTSSLYTKAKKRSIHKLPVPTEINTPIHGNKIPKLLKAFWGIRTFFPLFISPSDFDLLLTFFAGPAKTSLVNGKSVVPGENLMSEISSFLSLNPTTFSNDAASKIRKPPSFWPTATVEPSGE